MPKFRSTPDQWMRSLPENDANNDERAAQIFPKIKACGNMTQSCAIEIWDSCHLTFGTKEGERKWLSRWNARIISSGHSKAGARHRLYFLQTLLLSTTTRMLRFEPAVSFTCCMIHSNALCFAFSILFFHWEISSFGRLTKRIQLPTWNFLSFQFIYDLRAGVLRERAERSEPCHNNHVIDRHLIPAFQATRKVWNRKAGPAVSTQQHEKSGQRTKTDNAHVRTN